jgi:hypothetical protein
MPVVIPRIVHPVRGPANLLQLISTSPQAIAAAIAACFIQPLQNKFDFCCDGIGCRT